MYTCERMKQISCLESIFIKIYNTYLYNRLAI